MKKETPKRKFTGEEIAKMKEVDIRTVDRKRLVDIKDVKINTDLPDTERMMDFVQQIGKQSLEDCIKATMFAENDN